ncbi:MAG: aldehyde ferredoxin oxidoreductase, partial [Desulfobacterium sp.]|nr:aldehyde ferredoxin oxidoreductase [Desulfobacterium sp.]
MGKLGGYAGEILKVNLKEKEICTEPIPLDWISRFIGGLGISFKLAYDNACPGKDALEPENVLIFGAGPFVGT